LPVAEKGALAAASQHCSMKEEVKKELKCIENQREIKMLLERKKWAAKLNEEPGIGVINNYPEARIDYSLIKC
jgi:hypothetical protein